MKKDSTQTGATLCSSMRPRSATTSWFNKFKLLAFAFMALLSVTQVWGETATIDFDTNQAPSGTSFTSTSGTITNVLSFSCAKNSSSTDPAYNSSDKQLRLYYATNGDGGSITITAASGVTFSAFEFASTTTPTIKYSVDGGAKTSISYIGGTDPKRYSVSNLNCSSITLQNCNTSSTQIRFKYITVTYSTSSGPKHDVNWYVNGALWKTTQVAEGATIDLPTNPEAPEGCEGKSFFGWTESSSYEDATTAPTIIGDDEEMGTTDENYYAVFATKELSSTATTAVKIDKSEITNGMTILLVDGDDDAIGNVRYTDTYNNYYIVPVSLTIVNGIITSMDNKTKYTVTKSGDYYVFKQGSNYLNMAYGYDDLSCNGTSDKWTIEQYKNGYSFQSYNNSDNHYIYGYPDGYIGDEDKFAFYLYASGTWSDFTTSCVACTPGAALSITSANTVTTGKTLSLTSTGGNGGTVIWSVTNGTGTATISGSTLTAGNVGTVTVKAHQDQNGQTCETDAEQIVTINSVTYTDLSSGQKSGHFQPSFLALSQIVIWGFFAFFCKKVFNIRCTKGAYRMHGGSRPSSQPLSSPFGTFFAIAPTWLIPNWLIGRPL